MFLTHIPSTTAPITSGWAGVIAIAGMALTLLLLNEIHLFIGLFYFLDFSVQLHIATSSLMRFLGSMRFSMCVFQIKVLL